MTPFRRRSRDRERHADQAGRELLEWLSHDLRTPISGIQALTEALEDGVVSTPDDVAHYARLIRAETMRLAEMVEDLLEMSQITSGTLMPGIGTAGDADADAPSPDHRGTGIELDEDTDSRAREA